MVSTVNVFKWKCFVSAKQMFAFWPVGTNQQMLLLTFPQADWHQTLPSMSFPFSQELSRDTTGGLVEAICKSNHLVKRPQTLLKNSLLGQGAIVGWVLSYRCFWRLGWPHRDWCVSWGAVPSCERACTELTAHRVALICHWSLCPVRAVVCKGLAQGQGVHLESVFIYMCVFFWRWEELTFSWLLHFKLGLGSEGDLAT